MEFDFGSLRRMDRSKLIISTIVPRPIGLVTSISDDGIVNAAPYSFFNGMSSEPPLVVLGLERYGHAMNKDTGDNIVANGEFVVNLVSEQMADAMNITAITFPPEVDELAKAELTAMDSKRIKPPYIAESPVAFECVATEILDVGDQNQIVVAEVLHMHIDDKYVDTEKMYVDTPALNLIGRMHGGGWYARTTDLFELNRIPLEDWDAQEDATEKGDAA